MEGSESRSSESESSVVTLTQSDFERMQNTLVELKTQNYALTEQARKSQTATSEALSRVSRLEQESTRAQRIIAKSKRALEVQQMAQETERMQRKMEEQQEEFRMQNQTLINELSKLVSTNEDLEARLKSLGLDSTMDGHEVTMDPNRDETVNNEESNRDEESSHYNKEHLVTKEIETDRSVNNELVDCDQVESKVTFSSGQVSFASHPRRASIASVPDNASVVSDLRRSVCSLQKERSTLLAKLQSGYEAFEAFKKETGIEKAESELRMEQLRTDFEGRMETLKGEQVEMREEQEKVIEQLKKENNRVNNQLEASSKSSESRKQLLDQMAVTIQKNVEEHQRKVTELQGVIEERDVQMKDTVSSISELRSDLNRLQSQNADLKRHNESLQSELDVVRVELNETKDARKASEIEHEVRHKEGISLLREELSNRIGELELQLEIANAERVEFDEKCRSLSNELQDGQEDRRILERKHTALLKDLKKQLAMERNRSEKLNERLKEASCSINEGVCISASPSPETDPERTSISSWSLMSSPVNTVNTDVAIKLDDTPLRPTDPSRSTSTTAMTATTTGSEEEHRMLMAKISSLQEERLVLEEQLNLLQTSSAAMADDLVQKSAIINFYCMNNSGNGNKSMSRTSVSSSSSPLPQSMKRVVDRLVQPDVQGSKEVQGLQAMLEETLTKNMHLQQDLNNMANELNRLKMSNHNNVQ